MYDLTADSEWGVLSPRPLGRWTKRKPTKRALVFLVCIFIAAVYGIRVWNARQHVLVPESSPRHEQHEQSQEPNQAQDKNQIHEEQNEPLNWDLLEKPPLFGRYHEAEMALPQHHVKDPFAGGKKYLWVENHVHGESQHSVCWETSP